MTKLIKTGEYIKRGSQFISSTGKESIKYLILKRKKVTPKKPEMYIMAQIKGAYHYISSLYPTNKESTFKAEYGGDNFKVDISEASVNISAI